MNHFPLFFIVSTAYRNTVCCVWERIQRKEGNSFEPQISTIECRKSSINRFNKNRIEPNFAQTKQQPNETLIDLCALRAIRRTCITHRSSIRFEQSSILWTLNETENVLQTIWINHHFTRRFNYLLKLQKRCRCWTPCNSLCIRLHTAFYTTLHHRTRITRPHCHSYVQQLCECIFPHSFDEHCVSG